jgi:hypothetical protein
MKLNLLVLITVSVLLNSCKAYLDTKSNNSIETDYMTFKYLKDHNELNYFNKVNSAADNQKFLTTHFSINLPKGLVFWKQLGNQFYFEYDSKQLIYIYSAYKNVGSESPNFELKDVENQKKVAEELQDYWVKERGYKYLNKRNNDRVYKLYTNGKYRIVFYNIKKKEFTKFHESVKTFAIQT